VIIGGRRASALGRAIRGFAAAVLATLLLLPAAAPATPVAPCARTAQLAYVAAAHAGQTGTVWLAAANGTARTRLLRAATPVLAPSGSMIALTRFGGSGGLGIFTACRTMVGKYFSARDAISGLAWSPDSSLLAAIVDPHPNGNEVFDQRLEVVNVATGQTTAVATGFLTGFGGPSFSTVAPYQIAYDNSRHVGSNPDVWSATIGQAPVQLTRSGYNEDPLWGPQGILYAHDATSGGTTLDIFAAGHSSTLMKLDGWPVAVSADGRHLLAEGAACGVIWPLTVDLDRRRVVRRLANGFAPFGISPDGGSVLISGSPPAGDCGGRRSRIEVVGFGGGKPSLVAYGVDPSWADSGAVNVQG
jgi:hypothetical protein